MASMTSVISLFVLLLATYCYSAPAIVKRPGTTTTPDYEFTTTEKTNVHNMNMHLMSDEDSKNVPKLNMPLTSGVRLQLETTTPIGKYEFRPSSTSEGFFHSSSPMTSTEKQMEHEPRSFEGFFQSSSPMTSTVEYTSTEKQGEHEPRASKGFFPSSSPMTSTVEYTSTEKQSEHEPRSSEGFFHSSSPMTSTVEYTSTEKQGEHEPRSSKGFFPSSSPMTSTVEYSSTNKHGLSGFEPSFMETSTKFEARAIRPESESENETTTHALSENEHGSDMTSTVRPSFDKSGSSEETTTMSASDESTTEPSSSVDSFGKTTGLLKGKRPEERSSTPANEESTTRSSGKSGKYTKTVSIIPGRITETNIYAVPSKSFIVKERVQDQNRPLSQDQSQTVVQKRNWDN